MVFSSVEDCRILRDLEDMEYVNGSSTLNENGEVIEFRLRCFTLKGLIFLEELQESVDSEGWKGRFKPYIPILIGWSLGLLTLFIGFLLNRCS